MKDVRIYWNRSLTVMMFKNFTFYSQDEKTLSFSLSQGWHDVGVHLVDIAGNVYDVQEADNIYVGYFWLWTIIGTTAVTGGTTALFIIRKRRKGRFDI